MPSRKYKKPTHKRHTVGEILEGILIVGFGIFIFQTVADFYIDQNPYNGYCCCNLELIDEFSEIIEKNDPKNFEILKEENKNFYS